jgi:hypothetical protein
MPGEARSGTRARRARQHGFGLAEALVSLAIAGGVVAAYYDAIATTLALERRSKAHAAAAVVAHALLDRIGDDIALEAGVLEGRATSGFTWRLQMTEGATVEAAAGAAPPSTRGLTQIDIDIAGGGLGRPWRLTTVRVGREQLR